MLAQLLAEDRRPPSTLWAEELVASRLLEYELWNRLHAMDIGASHGDTARLILGRVSLLELRPSVLERALRPFPLTVRTLDALHLASVVFLRERGKNVEVATYDERMAEACRAMGLRLAAL